MGCRGAPGSQEWRERRRHKAAPPILRPASRIVGGGRMDGPGTAHHGCREPLPPPGAREQRRGGDGRLRRWAGHASSCGHATCSADGWARACRVNRLLGRADSSVPAHPHPWAHSPTQPPPSSTSRRTFHLLRVWSRRSSMAALAAQCTPFRASSFGGQKLVARSSFTQRSAAPRQLIQCRTLEAGAPAAMHAVCGRPAGTNPPCASPWVQASACMAPRRA